MQVMAALLAAGGIAVGAGGGEQPLPTKVAACCRILPSQGIRQGHETGLAGAILAVKPFYGRHLAAHGLDERRGQDGVSVLATFAVAE
jgi:hypothetical protein